MKCPHCNKELDFIAPVKMNCETYGNTPKGTTNCCGNIVALQRTIILTPFIPYNHNELIQDDWGIRKKNKLCQEVK